MVFRNLLHIKAQPACVRLFKFETSYSGYIETRPITDNHRYCEKLAFIERSDKIKKPVRLSNCLPIRKQSIRLANDDVIMIYV